VAEQKRRAESQDEKARSQELQQEAADREAARQAAFAASGGGPVGPPDDISIQAVAARLGDTRFQTAQRQAMAARIRRVSGNQYLQRLMVQTKQSEPDTGLLATQLQPSVSPPSTLQMRLAPSATKSVGGGGTYTFVSRPAGAKGAVLGPGQSGFSMQLLKDVPAAALKNLGSFAAATITPVRPNLKQLDKQIKLRIKHQQDNEDKAAGKGSLWGAPSPYFEAWYKNRAADCAKHVGELLSQKLAEQEKCAGFNAWAPRANQTFVSAARLAGLQDLLGVRDPEAMVAAVTESLKEAQAVAERAQVARPGTLDVPEADRKVTSSSAATTIAAREMRVAWLGFQQTLIKKEITSLEEAGEEDRKRLEEINKAIDTWANIGKTIDVSLAVIQGGKKLIAVGGAEPAKELGKTIAGGVGIPTDVEGLAKGIAKLVYSKEIATIERKLNELNKAITAHSEAAEQLGVREKVARFKTAFDKFRNSCKDLQDRLVARQLAYLKLGEQLDAAARKDPRARKAGTAPGAGKERFATVMLVTSAIREVLAMGSGAKGGYDSPGNIKNWLVELDATRKRKIMGSHRQSFGVPNSEAAPLISLYTQLATFHGNVDTLTKLFGPVEKQAAAMMKALSAGSEEAAAY